MRRVLIYLSVFFSLCTTNATAQIEPPAYTSSSGINSVRVYEATTPEKNPNTLIGKVPANTKQTTQYFDGLGRPIQTVTRQGSPLGKDLVSASLYDNLGRMQYSFLPFVSSQTPGGSESTDNGDFKLNPFQQQKAFYQSQLNGQNENFFYGKVEFDGSPLNRVVKGFQPGTTWVGSDIGSSVNYDINKANEKVHIWDLALNATLPTTSSTRTYETGKLSKTLNVDLGKTIGIPEIGKKTITYVDLNGNTVLKKVQDKDVADLTIEHSGWICTYYVYDDFNQLRFIIPPKAVAYLDNNNWNLSDAIVNELCFRYEYDQRGRVIVKKQPGAGEILMVYDDKDRVVLSQDANLDKLQNPALSTSKWTFYLYDEYDRVVATGILDNNRSRQSFQDYLDNLPETGNVTVSAFVGNSTNQAFLANCPIGGYGSNDSYLTNSNVVYNSISHYDNYDYEGVKPFNTSYSLAYTPPQQNIEAIEKTNRTLGFLTGEKIRVIDNDNNNSNDRFIFSTAYYDDKGRAVQTLTTNIKDGTDYNTDQFDFAGKLMSSFVSHYDGVATYTIISKNEYDKDGRLIKLFKNFNNTFYKQLAEYSYDELGQLKEKRLAPGYTGSGKQEMETQIYNYNINGSLTGINKDFALSSDNASQWDHYFGQYLGYDNRDNLFSEKQYNGSITGVIWKSQGDNSPRKYNYTYDNLGRFTSALFLQKKNPAAAWSNTDLDFSVYAEYEDGNGNLKSLKQMGVLPGSNGIQVMDDLRYHYKDVATVTGLTGNQLKRVDDNLNTLSNKNGLLGDFKDGINAAGTDDYMYDANGNLTSDANKSIASNGIIYNYLNKPVKITLQNKSIVEYIYDASGEKLTKKVTNSITNNVTYTHYMGDFVYEETGAVLSLKYILHEEGRVKIITPVANATTNTGVEINSGTSGFSLAGGKQGVFEYFIKDHLGNTRMVLTEEVQTEFYRAYMETANAATEELLFGKVDIINNVPQASADNELKRARTGNSSVSTPWTNNNTEFVSLSAASGKTVGPNMILKVMAGDVINASARYFYHSNNSTSGSQNPVTDAVVSLIYALTGSHASSIDKLSHANISSYLNSNTGDFSEFITSTQPNTGNSAAPKAYLNIVFLDEQFKFIKTEGISGVGSDAQRVSSPDDVNASISPMIQKAPKNGWVYVYLSNESNEPVYFDDFFVSQEHSRISEENHYYPHGLKMAGITSHAFNKLENNYGYQGDYSESDDETGWNDFELRSYDPQIGRFIQHDPYEQFASPYIGMGNDPVNIVDPSGGFSLASITGSTSVLFNTTATTIAGFLIGGITGMVTGDDKGWLKGAAIGASLGLAISYNAELNAMLDVFRTSLQIQNRIFGRSLDDLSDHLMDAADKLNRWNNKDKMDFRNHFGVDDNNSRVLIKNLITKEQQLIEEYLYKKTYKTKIQRTNVFGPGTFAWVNSNDPGHIIHLENDFWLAKRKGEDSKFGTLGHEISHFNDIGGTNDNGGYGTGNARARATPARAADALKAADSFEYYIEKVRL